MKELVKMDIPIVRRMVKKEEAIELFRTMGEDFKVELVEGIGDSEVSLYTQGNFTDLCRGPHLPSTGS